MFRVTVTDLRSGQSDVFSADIDKVSEIKKMLTPTKGDRNRDVVITKDTKLVIAPDEFFKTVRRDYTGKAINEDGKFIEYMNGQRLEKYFPNDIFTPETNGVYQMEDGEYFLKLRLDPSRHGGKGARMVRLVPQN